MPTLYDEDGNPVEIPDNPADLRNEVEAARKSAREAEKRALSLEKELAPIREQARLSAVTAAFAEEGLGVKEVKLFLRINPDAEATPENIASFVEEFELKAPAEEAPAPATPAAQTYQPVTDGRPTGAPTPIARKELDALYRTDPERARSLIAAGAVDWNNPATVSQHLRQNS